MTPDQAVAHYLAFQRPASDERGTVTRDRDFFRQQVLVMLADLDLVNSTTGRTSGADDLARAVVLGYLRGSAVARTADEHRAATLGALDAFDEVREAGRDDAEPAELAAGVERFARQHWSGKRRRP